MPVLHSTPLTTCILPDYRLLFRGVADIVHCRGQSVAGALYEITQECERALDRYEGFPNLYVKDTFMVRIRGSKKLREAMFYTMCLKTAAPPSRWYVECIREGYDDWELPHDCLDAALARALGPSLRKRA